MRGRVQTRPARRLWERLAAATGRLPAKRTRGSGAPAATGRLPPPSQKPLGAEGDPRSARANGAPRANGHGEQRLSWSGVALVAMVVTMKVARSALHLPLALWERAG